MTLKVGAIVTFSDPDDVDSQEAIACGGAIWIVKKIGIVAHLIKSVCNGETRMASKRDLVLIEKYNETDTSN